MISLGASSKDWAKGFLLSAGILLLLSGILAGPVFLRLIFINMTYDNFILTIENDEQPPNLPLYLQALWYDAKGDWNKAHSLIDSLDDLNSCWVHAYLHRKEGDTSNADYWYHRANKKRATVSLNEEWKTLASELLLKF